jgi:hypothetical protein
MTIPHDIRASDHPEIIRASNSEGFVVRKPHPSIKRGYQICMLIGITFIGIYVLVLNDALMASLMCVLIGTIMLVLAKRIERLQGMLNATEFSNALFTSALTKGYLFTMIAAKNGDIVYLDRNTQAAFPDFIEQPKRTLDLLLTTHGTPPEQCQYIESLVSQPSRADVPMLIQYGVEKTPRQVTLAIDPIDRPKGFVVLRGHD